MSNEPLKIVPATTADKDKVWEMWKWVMDQGLYFPYDESYSREYIEHEWINLSKNQVFVAIDGNQVVGAYILKQNQPGHGKHIANAAYMVSSEVLGKGIGTQLCAHSIEAAKKHGYRGIQFNLVVSTNTAAIKAWLKNGFEIIGTIPEGFHHRW